MHLTFMKWLTLVREFSYYFFFVLIKSAVLAEDEKQFLRNKSGKQSDRLVEDMEMVNPEFVRDNSKVTHPIFIRKTMIGAEIKNLINASRESVSYENLM